MRILFLASKLSEPSCRFRFLQFIPYLRARGIEVVVMDLAVPAVERLQIFRQAAQYDVVLIHRVLLGLLDFWSLRLHVRRYVFDFDDAIFLRDSSHRKGMRSWQRSLRFKRMVQSSQRVIAGNRYLGEWARKYQRDVIVLPTTVDLNGYPRTEQKDNGTPTIGWIGTRSNLVYLESIAGALARIGASACKPALKIVSDAFFDCPGIEVIKKEWTLEEEPSDVASFQIGIMPLPDDPWTRGKCALKILQYMAAARPVVCSPVGANLEIVVEGQTGYFARTEDEWVSHLDRLLSCEEERARCGAAGRDRVERYYSTEAAVNNLLNALTLTSSPAELPEPDGDTEPGQSAYGK